ncbi:hypothetical protein [Marinobacter sp.]|uniref:hypothetical protein n=1 Tax=Marinobacter sp. TaxID=50741 RepID=UPI003569720A
MRRLYFLMPDIATTHGLVEELLLTHVEEHHIHVVAKEGTPMEELPEANLMQKSDFIPAIEKGLTLGAATGLICGLVAMALPATGVIVGGGAVLFITAAGAGVGSLMSSLVGVGLPNSRLAKFEEKINAGEVLVLVDVKHSRVHEIEELVRKHHPEAHIEGTEPLTPPFP